MNLEEVVKAIDTAVFTKTGRHLNEVEIILLRGAWQGKTYEQMVETCQYSLAYLKQAAGPKLWKLLSEALGQDVSKTSFRAVLERTWQTSQTMAGQLLGAGGAGGQGDKGTRGQGDKGNLAQSSSSPSSPSSPSSSSYPTPYLDWGEAPDVTLFYGRTGELVTLEQWIVKERCRLVAIVGMGGIGKTTLSVRSAKQIQDEFEFVVWRSLRNAPPISELLGDLIQSLSQQQTTHLSADIDNRVSQLTEYLHQHRCLLILDSVETILRRGELAGHYRLEHEGYREFLRRLGETPHQSCLLLTSLEKPREIAALEGKTSPVRCLQLTGLQAEAQEIFKEKSLSEAGRWDELIQLYRGNPLALKIVTTTIRELFGGNVAEFLKQNTIVFGDIRDILDEQFERLSDLEQQILYWLAVECHPVSLSELRTNIFAPGSQAELIEALESLLRRSLISTNVNQAGETLFTLQQPVVSEYVKDQFIKQVCAEIQELFKTQKIEKIELFRNHALVNQQQDEEVKQLQLRLILAPVKDRLCTIYRDEKLIEEQLNTVLSMLQGKSQLAVGYVGENIQNLLLELKSISINYDFSYNA
jgi:hypothetical protein